MSNAAAFHRRPVVIQRNVVRLQSHVAHYNTAAELLLFEHAGELRETKKTNLDAFVKQAAREHRGKVELAGRKAVDVLDEMQEIFLPRDRLLGSAGQVPFYYWFVGQRSSKEYRYIREFLVTFEEQRRNNRSRANENPKDRSIDRQFVDYDQFKPKYKRFGQSRRPPPYP
jgi:hypothetical protein